MKIAVIGSGIIGYIASSYLSEQGHEVDCISPRLDTVKKILPQDESTSKKYKKPVSPKFQRKDFQESKLTSDFFYEKNCRDFIGLELIDQIGLARYWGANLAIGGLSENLNDLDLSDKEQEFIKSHIPILDVLSYYDEISKDNHSLDQLRSVQCHESTNSLDIRSSTLAIWKHLCSIDNLPDDRSNPAIFGSQFTPPSTYNFVDGYATRIEFKDKAKKPGVVINTTNDYVTKHYDQVLVCCGAIGSYRLIMNSLTSNGNSSYHSRLKHHIILPIVFFIPKLKYPRKYITMSNFDIQASTRHGRLYLNYFPFKGALKAMYRQRINNPNLQFIKPYLKSIIKFARQLPDLPIFPGWWLDRLYVSNINFSSDYTSSYIGLNEGKVDLVGGFRFDFEKHGLGKLLPSVLWKLAKKMIIPIIIRPKTVEIGGDMHYSSTLSSFTDSQGNLSYKDNLYQNIKIIDSSSSEILPTPNPTYYFVARAVRLLRSLDNQKDDNQQE